MQVKRSRMSRLPYLRIPLLTLLVCLYFRAPNAGATVIEIDLGAAPNITSEVDSSFADLDGIALNGQTVSLDFFFSSGEFVRLFSITSDSFHAQITLQTSGMGQVGFLSGTGFLFDQHGNPLDPEQDLGSASGDDGSMAAGLFPLFGSGLPRP